jgi:hypothetical protein
MRTSTFSEHQIIGILKHRVLNILDKGTRECLDIVDDTSRPVQRVVRTLQQLKQVHGLPRITAQR